MRISRDNIIRITGKITTSGLFKNLKVGNEISGKIIQRLGGNFAIMDIGGRKIRADFLNGVPSQDNINLVVEEKKGSLIKLRRIPSGTRQILQQLSGFSILFFFVQMKWIHISGIWVQAIA